jgi:hypothetical protein
MAQALKCLPFLLSFNECLTLDAALIYVHKPQEDRTKCAPERTRDKLKAVTGREGKTYNPKRKAKGMLSLFPEAVIIAEDTKGPMKADVFPIYR